MNIQSIDRSKWSEPTALGFSRGEVSAFASNIATKLGYAPGEALEPLVERLGGVIEYGDDMDQSESGSIRIFPGGFKIYISMDTSPLRDRFTTAHELGHYVLHYLYANQHRNANIQYLRAQRYGSGPAENEANWFAAAFLMPGDKFRAKFDEFKDSSNRDLRLADFFKVSQQAASIRAKSLSLE
ncbi:ImmA/IrrE family metallo-endopeptidase [Solilutibacter silvestris]|uniref:IrrE N-terminal-like domain-containing protein n=1 Tax=Solilutibacter silvestris TaxID=1645665 RepID=A0A2K1Q1F6_9GAMM|nr:ImmA/IrrE family metallo-endopeptidase [Lysobacter silvestris]PNS08862.1 hypothetical protein Lysil_0491 [Lysobacter silvestris]